METNITICDLKRKTQRTNAFEVIAETEGETNL